MKLHGPIAFVEIYGSNGAMSIRRRVRLTFGDPLRLGAPPPNHVSSPSAPSSSKRKLFAIFGPYGPIYFAARAPTSSTYRPLAARKLTRCRFGEPSRNSSCVAALADCWRLRFDSSRRPRAPRTWIHLNRIYKKHLEEKNGTGGPNRSTGGGRIDFSITRSCSRIASTASCDLRLWPIEK